MSAISDTLRAVANVIDDAARVGIPVPQTVSTGTYTPPYLIMGDFADVEAWGDYLEAPVERYTSSDDATDHIATSADLSDVYGISVRVTTNRPHVCEPAS